MHRRVPRRQKGKQFRPDSQGDCHKDISGCQQRRDELQHCHLDGQASQHLTHITANCFHRPIGGCARKRQYDSQGQGVGHQKKDCYEKSLARVWNLE